MSSIKVNDKTVSVAYAGDSSTMTTTYKLEDEDIVTFNMQDHDSTKDLLMSLLEKLDLAEPQLTFTAPAGGIYAIQASSFGVTAIKI